MNLSVSHLHELRARITPGSGAAHKLAIWRTQHQARHEDEAIHGLSRSAPEMSAKRRFNTVQKWMLRILCFILIMSLIATPLETLIVMNGLFIMHGATVFLLRGAVLYYSIKERESGPLLPHQPILTATELPIVTILCPLYNEVKGLPGLVGALQKLDYPPEKLDIKIVLEADDYQTIMLAKLLCATPPFDIIIVPAKGPRTKPKACNYALWSALGELLVIYDAEDRPEPAQLTLAANCFAQLPKDVACLQARLNYYNRDKTWITRLFSMEYALLFDLILPGLDALKAPLPLGGTSNIFRTDDLVRVGGWDPYNVTEDADLGLRMSAAGLTSRVLDSTTYEEATTAVKPWLRQRSRWIKGYLQTWIVHMRGKLADRSWPFFLTLHFLVGSVVIAAFFNPIFWTLYIMWLMGIGDWIEPLFPSPLAGMATLSLLLGNFFHLWLFMLAPMRRQWHDLVPFAFLAPFYWLLQSIAGYKALLQFIVKPHYWEKTDHSAGEHAETVFAKAKSGSI
ncbi:MAG: glycosyltransferase family 2 protein [Pseudomonadota bacterium]